jgi:hypothetical protein
MASVRKLTWLVLLAAACRAPVDDWDAFLARTCRGAATDVAPVPSRFADLTGDWLVHALLAGGLDLNLRMRFVMTGNALHAQIWLATANPDTDAPLIETDTTVASDGTFTLTAEPLVLGPGALKVDSTVEANVVLSASTQAADSWCGTASGTVEKPLSLDLAGSTFAARRNDGKTPVSAVPSSCNPGAMTETTCGSDGPMRPPSPDLSSVPSKLADLTGQWILNSKLAGSLPEKLWVSLSFVPATDGSGGSLDGALRKATDAPGGAALLTFSTVMSPDGRFELWLPNLSIGAVKADLLLEGATLDMNGFCGKGAGQVHQPLDLDLDGTTFGAARWTPGTPVPDNIPDRCP